MPSKKKSNIYISSDCSSDDQSNKTSSDEDEEAEVKIIETPAPKKRGRPKKNNIVPKMRENYGKIKQESDDEEIILEIPFKYNNTNKKNTTTGFNFASSTNELPELSGGTRDIKILLNELNKKNAIIEKLKLEKRTDNFLNTTEIKIKKQLESLNFIHDKKIKLDKTNISCWWCTYNFDCPPCFIPDRSIENTYYVFGCFCSYNCALAYNIDMKDSKVKTRTALLKTIYRKMFGYNDLRKAPQRETLKKFGGLLDIDEFRDSTLIDNKKYLMNLPPMTSLIPTIEIVEKRY